MAINHSLAVYIPKGEHDDPHELPQQQDLEGSTQIDHTLYSHTDNTFSEKGDQRMSGSQFFTSRSAVHYV